MMRLLKRRSMAQRLYGQVKQGVRSRLLDVDTLNQQMQKILVNQYKADARRGVPTHDAIGDAGFRCYSEFEEDGIILYVLSVVGMTTKKVVEMCIGNGEVCMATNLILNHGYQGFLFDGNPREIRHAEAFFGARRDARLAPPILRSAWITRETVNDLLRQVGAAGEVDLLSLDLDGNDYHIWEAVTAIQPRLCVFETHDIIPTHLSLTIPYDPDFNCWAKQGVAREFRSASLAAMTKLSKRKGYRLIGGHRHGFNVFFLREDLGQGVFPAVTIEQVHDKPWTRRGQAERWPLVEAMEWLEV